MLWVVKSQPENVSADYNLTDAVLLFCETNPVQFCIMKREKKYTEFNFLFTSQTVLNSFK